MTGSTPLSIILDKTAPSLNPTKVNLDINDPPIRSEAREVLATPKQKPLGIELERGEAVWRPDLQCHVHAVAYCFQHRAGALLLAKNNCTDMTRAIELFERIDPYVNRVDTWSGDAPDTSYVRDEDSDKWRAYQPITEEENE